MKNKDIFRELGGVDEKFILEADPTAARKSTWRKKLAVMAACISIFAVFLSLWLFMPFSGELEDLSKYSDSEYYALMLKVQQLASRPDNYRFKNNFEKYFFVHEQSGENDVATVGTLSEATPADKYAEVTDNQFEGIIEGDLFKRSEKSIFYLDPLTLTLYSYSTESAELLDTVNIPEEFGFPIKSIDHNNSIIYLSPDCKSITVILPKYQFTEAVSIDVSDPADMKKGNTFQISGGFMTSRMIDGKLLTVTGWGVGTNPDFPEKGEYLPQFTSGGKTQYLAADAISFTDDAWRAFYTVVALIDPATLEVIDSAAVLDYAGRVTVSENNIFLCGVLHERSERAGENEGETVFNITQKSTVYAISHAGGKFEHLGNIKIDGLPTDQYALDERDGVLRIVTETQETEYIRIEIAEGYMGAQTTVDIQSANLYCIDLETFEIIGSVKAFSPHGEDVTAVRFEGDYGYVCTAEKVYNRDPVYFFDLSDPANITYSDTGVIDGYSTSLVDMGGGKLLGIGYGDSDQTLKVEVYEEKDDRVVSVCAFELNYVEFSEDYKSYYINRAEGLVGLTVSHLYGSEYVLLKFDGEVIKQIESVAVPLVENVDYTRSTVIGDTLFIFAENDFKTAKIDQ
ncbi:MAG: beta-propeller domain-containing protein [Clostridia bacterium]|nr:beta-propeller domain-containing protein [Clostridia bacterium]